MPPNAVIEPDTLQWERIHELASVLETQPTHVVEERLARLVRDGEDSAVVECLRISYHLPPVAGPPAPPPPRLKDRYVLEEQIGEGGMGMVYRALQIATSRHVAVKVINPALTSAFTEKLFHDEIQLLARLEHPGIVRIYDADVHPDAPNKRAIVFFAMELVAGRTLAARLRDGRMQESEALALGRRLCAALHHAHDRGISHLDLKPGNIILREKTGDPVILDFGLAAIPSTGTGMIFGGTPAYMSPEQLSREPATAPDLRTADIYSLGVVLFECLSGERPHVLPSGISLGDAAEIICESPPRRLRDLEASVSAETERVLHKAMRPSARDRYQSAAELSRALEVALTALTGSGPGAPASFRPACGAQIPSTDWILDRRLGEGSSGEVWSGHHAELPQRRVFKFCAPGISPRLLKRELTLFKRLAERSRDRSGFVRLYDIALETPPCYLMLEDVGGTDLANWAATSGSLNAIPLTSRLAIVIRLAEILQLAHDAGVVHRDVKPANVLIAVGTPDEAAPDAPGKIFLTDFGIGEISILSQTQGGPAQLTRLTALGSEGSGSRGTPLYIAPEIHAGKHASPRSDIYALGVIFYQLVVGDLTRPLTLDWRDQIPDTLLADDLAACLATAPDDRPAGASWLAERLPPGRSPSTGATRSPTRSWPTTWPPAWPPRPTTAPPVPRGWPSASAPSPPAAPNMRRARRRSSGASARHSAGASPAPSSSWRWPPPSSDTASMPSCARAMPNPAPPSPSSASSPPRAAPTPPTRGGES